MVSAQAVLQSGSLTAFGAVSQTLAAGGFSVGPLVGMSFSLTAPAATFVSYFRLAGLPPAPEDWPDHLPLTALPTGLRQHIQAVLFTAPPAFGPGAGP